MSDQTKKYNALYGTTAIKKSYCPKCKAMAFVIDGEMTCCDTPISEFNTRRIKIESEASGRRAKPSLREQKKILEQQEHRCFYCDVKFGTLVWRETTGKQVLVKINWDHLIPYSYAKNNKSANFVASCHICNGIKSNKMFDTVEDVRNYFF